MKLYKVTTPAMVTGIPFFRPTYWEVGVEKKIESNDGYWISTATVFHAWDDMDAAMLYAQWCSFGRRFRLWEVTGKLEVLGPFGIMGLSSCTLIEELPVPAIDWDAFCGIPDPHKDKYLEQIKRVGWPLRGSC